MSMCLYMNIYVSHFTSLTKVLKSHCLTVQKDGASDELRECKILAVYVISAKLHVLCNSACLFLAIKLIAVPVSSGVKTAFNVAQLSNPTRTVLLQSATPIAGTSTAKVLLITEHLFL